MEKIIKILMDIRPDITFSINMKLLTSGYLDSLDVIKTVSSIEREYNISISASDITLDNFEKIESIQKLIEKYKK
jgi:D-alanine--poly(phosphoribitol) ligase subunit 2